MKNILIFSSSPREKSNSHALCEQFFKGATEAGHNVELIRLKDKKINYCVGCHSCENTGVCFQKDDMFEIQEKILKADVLVFATPVYFYSMSAQLKTLIDRVTPFYTEVRADIYLFATAWDPDTKNLESTLEAIRGCTRDCFENCEEKGALAVGDVSSQNAIKNKTEVLKKAYEMGKNC